MVTGPVTKSITRDEGDVSNTKSKSEPAALKKLVSIKFPAGLMPVNVPRSPDERGTAELKTSPGAVEEPHDVGPQEPFGRSRRHPVDQGRHGIGASRIDAVSCQTLPTPLSLPM
jgi:hypothetical protein